MNTADFNYDLPSELIAQTPLNLRDHSRLMVLDRADNSIQHHFFYDLPNFLRKGDVLVFNDSRVIPARLKGRLKDTETKVELLLLSETENNSWEALAKPSRRIRIGSTIEIETRNKETAVPANVLSKNNSGTITVQFPNKEILKTAGIVPLPPYIHTSLFDEERYQTVYSQYEGSVAAPTAGLHFTPTLMNNIRGKGIEFVFVTLHVGLGTFRPVKVDDPQKHQLHHEFCHINQDASERLNQAKTEGRRIICVGTTSVRAIEGSVRPNGKIKPFNGWNGLFILPGFRFQIANAMITNFHLPCSTLLMLVAAFAGKEEIFGAYQEAIGQEYRFYSFGDCMLIHGNVPTKT